MRLPDRLLHQYPRSTTGLVLAGICLSATIAVVLAYQPEITRQRQQADQHRQDLADQVRHELASRFATVQQQVHNLGGLVGNQSPQPAVVENTLLALLKASPASHIYGMGVWYRPGEIRGFPGGLYGPYAYYPDNAEAILTREWMTPAYNYPTQDWYALIASGRGDIRCTAPYWDMHQVFLSCGKSFPAGDANPRGMVSVDMVLPQLNQMLKRLGTPQQETLFLTHGAQLLAHPDAEAMVTEARRSRPTVNSLLDLPAGAAMARLPATGNWSEYRQTLDYGWELHIVSRQSWLNAGLNVLYQRIGFWLVMIWLTGALIDAVWLYTTRHIRTALNRNLSLRNALSDAVPSGVFLCDEEQQIVWANPAFFRLAGETQLPAPLNALTDTEDHDKIHQLWQAAATQDTPASVEFRLARDADCWVHLRLVRVKPDETHGSGMAGTIDDVTERRNTEEALRLAKDEAEKASRAKGDFLATMSHEIRTPMNGVIGMANLLQESGLNTEQTEYARTLQSSAGTLLKIINDILDLSRIEAGKFPIEQHPFRLPELVGEVLSLLQPLAAQKDIDLDSGLPSDLPPVVIGDADRVKQVLLNLIGNAIKFTDSGSVTLSVTVSEPANQRACLSFHVIDTGIGLSLDQQSRIFTPFTQADSSTTRRYGGTGLGLAICRHLIALMGGEIHCYSEPGEGAHFWFDLEFPLPQTGSPATGTQADTTPRALRANARILVVEDNPVNLQVVKAMLKKLGLHAEHADNGEDALARLSRESDWDLVLMDCQMPVLDGFDTTRRWRTLENSANRQRLPIVALTANAMSGDAERCLEAGMDAYLSKPLTLAALTTELGRWLAV